MEPHYKSESHHAFHHLLNFLLIKNKLINPIQKLTQVMLVECPLAFHVSLP